MENIRTAIINAAATLGLVLDETQITQLEQYLHLLQKWNQAYNLTALKTTQDLLVKHVFDCLAVVKPIETLLNERLPLAKSVLDVGTGAGLPGLMLAICMPECQVTMLDAISKKITFVQHAILQLKLHNATASATRIQDYRGQHTVITARAWTTLADIPTLTVHALSEGGCIAAMKGPRLESEAQTLSDNWVIDRVLPIVVPYLADERSLAILSRKYR